MQTTRFEVAGFKCVEVSPAGSAGRDLPLVIVLHGRGDWGESFTDLPPILNATDYRYVFPTARLPLPGAMFEWFRFDQSNFASASGGARSEVSSLIQALTARYKTPAARTVLGGFSQGGMMTLEVGLRYPQKLAGLMSLSSLLVADARLNLEGGRPDAATYYAQDAALLPMLAEAVRLGQGPVLVAHGTHDPVVPVQAGRGTRDILQQNGIEVEYYEFEGGHQLTPDELDQIRTFLNRVLR